MIVAPVELKVLTKLFVHPIRLSKICTSHPPPLPTWKIPAGLETCPPTLTRFSAQGLLTPVSAQLKFAALFERTNRKVVTTAG